MITITYSNIDLNLDITLQLVYFVNTMSVTFEWDDNKNIANQKKHRVSFEEAQTVFVDENALLICDPDHSDEEDRFILLGLSVKLKMLIVCHCYRESNDFIRIISARKATRREQKYYWVR